MNLLQGVCIFLGAVAIALVIMILILTALLHNVQAENRAAREHITGLQADNALLIEDKRELTRQNEQLQERNDILAAMAKELTSREVVKVQYDDEQPILYFEQEEPETAAVEEILQANAKERLPEGVATNRYDCEGFKFPAGTQQAMLQEVCVTDWQPQTAGLRYYFDGEVFYYCVALGGAYGIDIGDTWHVTLQNGAEFNVILSDYQHGISDPDPDDFGERYEYDSAGNVVGLLRNYDGEICVHVLEFIADIGRLSPKAKGAGGMHGVDFFGGMYGDGGDIAKIEYLGRKWKP